MASVLEIPSLGRRDFRGMVGVVCVVCGREREGRGREERGGEERKRDLSTPLLLLHPLSFALRSALRDPLRGTPPDITHHTTHSHHHTQPTLHRPKNGGSPPPPHQGKGRKRRGKRGFLQPIILNFSLGENPQTPPHSTNVAKKRQERRGRALCSRAGQNR